MRTPSRKLLVPAGVIAVLLVVGVVCAVADELGAALVCVLLVQGIGVLAILEAQRRQAGVTAAVKAAAAKNAAAIEAVSRDVANVSERVVSESSLLQTDLRERADETQIALDRRADLRLQEIEAMFQLFGRFDLRAAMPASGPEGLDAAGLLLVVDLIARRRVNTIVGLGSGTSTLWLSYALEKRGAGSRIISLDHEPTSAETTRATLSAHGFEDGPAEVRDAPLTPDVLEGHLSPWYDPRTVEDVADIDLLLVEGPPRATGDMARHPALPVLLSRLAPGAIIVVDDATHPEETAVIECWLAEVPGLRRLDEAGLGRQVLLVLEG